MDRTVVIPIPDTWPYRVLYRHSSIVLVLRRGLGICLNARIPYKRHSARHSSHLPLSTIRNFVGQVRGYLASLSHNNRRFYGLRSGRRVSGSFVVWYNWWHHHSRFCGNHHNLGDKHITRSGNVTHDTAQHRVDYATVRCSSTAILAPRHPYDSQLARPP